MVLLEEKIILSKRGNVMENIEQKITRLYEDGINYQIINNEKNKYEYTEENIIKNQSEFISLLKKRKGISIIISFSKFIIWITR